MAKAFIRDCLLAIGIAAGMWIIPAAAADLPEGSQVIPGSKVAELENCVRKTDFMRRNHMELIEHQRDRTVHRGIRATTDSLAGCIDCHVGYDQQGQPVSVYEDGQFCKNCHEFAAVELDCFGCHAAVPTHPGTETRDRTPPTAGIETPDVTRKVEQGG